VSTGPINAIASISKYTDTSRIDENNFSNVSVISLEDRFKEAISNQAVTDQFTRERIYSALNDPNVTSDPQKLVYWQQQLSVYTLDVNLCSTLARKGVAAIETLVKT